MAVGLQSIKNNLERCNKKKYHADEAMFYVRRLKEETSIPMQKIIAQLLLSGIQNDPEFSPMYEGFKEEWEAKQKENNDQ